MVDKPHKIITFRLTEGGPLLEATVRARDLDKIDDAFVRKFILERYSQASFTVSRHDKLFKAVGSESDKMARALDNVGFRQSGDEITATDLSSNRLFWSSRNIYSDVRSERPPLVNRVVQLANTLLGHGVPGSDALPRAADTISEHTPSIDATKPTISIATTAPTSASKVPAIKDEIDRCKADGLTHAQIVERLCLDSRYERADVIHALQNALSPAKLEALGADWHFWTAWPPTKERAQEALKGRALGVAAAEDLLRRGYDFKTVWECFLCSKESGNLANLDKVLQYYKPQPEIAESIQSTIKNKLAEPSATYNTALLALAPLCFLKCSPDAWPDTDKLAELCHLTEKLRDAAGIRELYSWTLRLPPLAADRISSAREKHLYIVKLLKGQRNGRKIQDTDRRRVAECLREFSRSGSVGNLIEACGALVGYRFGSGESLRAILGEPTLEEYLGDKVEVRHLDQDKIWHELLQATRSLGLREYDGHLSLAKALHDEMEPPTFFPAEEMSLLMRAEHASSLPAVTPAEAPTDDELLHSYFPQLYTLFQNISSDQFGTSLEESYKSLLSDVSRSPTMVMHWQRLMHDHSKRVQRLQITEAQVKKTLQNGYLRTGCWDRIADLLNVDQRKLEQAFFITIVNFLRGLGDESLLTPLALEWLIHNRGDQTYSRGTLVELCGLLAGLEPAGGVAIAAVQKYVFASPNVSEAHKQQRCWILPPREYGAVTLQEEIWIALHRMRKTDKSQHTAIINEVLETICFECERDATMRPTLPFDLLKSLPTTLKFLGDSKYSNLKILIDCCQPSGELQERFLKLFKQYIKHLADGKDEIRKSIDELVAHPQCSEQDKRNCNVLLNDLTVTMRRISLVKDQNLQSLVALFDPDAQYRCHIPGVCIDRAREFVRHLKSDTCSQYSDWEQIKGKFTSFIEQQKLQALIMAGSDEPRELDACYTLLKSTTEGALSFIGEKITPLIPETVCGVNLYQLLTLRHFYHHPDAAISPILERYQQAFMLQGDTETLKQIYPALIKENRDRLLWEPEKLPALQTLSNSSYDADLSSEVSEPSDPEAAETGFSAAEDPFVSFLRLSCMTPYEAQQIEKQELQKLCEQAGSYMEVLQETCTLDYLYVNDYPAGLTQTRKYQIEKDKEKLFTPTTLRQYFPSLRKHYIPGVTEIVDRARDLFYYDLIQPQPKTADALLKWYQNGCNEALYEELRNFLRFSPAPPDTAHFIDLFLVMAGPRDPKHFVTSLGDLEQLTLLRQHSEDKTILRMQRFLWKHHEDPMQLLHYGIVPANLQVAELLDALARCPDSQDKDLAIDKFFSLGGGNNLDALLRLLDILGVADHPLRLLLAGQTAWPDALTLAKDCLSTASTSEDSLSLTILQSWSSHLPELSEKEAKELRKLLKRREPLSPHEVRRVNLGMVRALTKLRHYNEKIPSDLKPFIESWLQQRSQHCCMVTEIETCGALAGLPFGSLQATRALERANIDIDKVPPLPPQFAFQDAIWHALLDGDEKKAVDHAIEARTLLLDPPLLLPLEDGVLRHLIDHAIDSPDRYFGDPISTIESLMTGWPISPEHALIRFMGYLKQAYEATSLASLQVAYEALAGLDRAQPLIESLENFIEQAYGCDTLAKLAALVDATPPLARRTLINLLYVAHVREKVLHNETETCEALIELGSEAYKSIASGISEEHMHDLRTALFVGILESRQQLKPDSKVGGAKVGLIAQCITSDCTDVAPALLADIRSLAMDSCLPEMQDLLKRIEEAQPELLCTVESLHKQSSDTGFGAVLSAITNQEVPYEPCFAWLLLNSLTAQDHAYLQQLQPHYATRLGAMADSFSTRRMHTIRSLAVQELQHDHPQSLVTAKYRKPADIQSNIRLINKYAKTTSSSAHADLEKLLHGLLQSGRSIVHKMIPTAFAAHLRDLCGGMAGLEGYIFHSDHFSSWADDMNQQTLARGLCYLPEPLERIIELPLSPDSLPLMKSLLEAAWALSTGGMPSQHPQAWSLLILANDPDYSPGVLQAIMAGSTKQMLDLDRPDTMSQIAKSLEDPAKSHSLAAVLLFLEANGQDPAMHLWVWQKLRRDVVLSQNIEDAALQDFIQKLELHLLEHSPDTAWKLASLTLFRQYASALELPKDESQLDNILDESVQITTQELYKLNDVQRQQYSAVIAELANPLEQLNQVLQEMLMHTAPPAADEDSAKAQCIADFPRGWSVEIPEEYDECNNLQRLQEDAREKLSVTGEHSASSSSEGAKNAIKSFYDALYQSLKTHFPDSEQHLNILSRLSQGVLGEVQPFITCLMQYINALRSNRWPESDTLDNYMSFVCSLPIPEQPSSNLIVRQRYALDRRQPPDQPIAIAVSYNPVNNRSTYSLEATNLRHRILWEFISFMHALTSPNSLSETEESSTDNLQLESEIKEIIKYQFIALAQQAMPPGGDSLPTDEELANEFAERLHPYVTLQSPVDYTQCETTTAAEFKHWIINHERLDPAIDDHSLYHMLVSRVKEYIILDVVNQPDTKTLHQRCIELFPDFPCLAALSDQLKAEQAKPTTAISTPTPIAQPAE